MTRTRIPKIARTYRLPERTVERLERFADQQGVKLTPAVVILLNYALDHFLGKEG